MANVKVVLNKTGVRELLQSNEMMSVCEGYANQALSRLGEGYTVSSMIGKNRAIASVYAESVKAKQENLENNTILKSLRG